MKTVKTIYGIIGALVLMSLSPVPVRAANKHQRPSAPSSSLHKPSLAYPEVVNPVIPMSMKFAGVEVDLSDADKAERLDRELTGMLYTHGNILLTIKRANRYFPIIVPMLRDAGVPTDLAYLACIESWLDPRAQSGAGAAGLWQFMPSTGKEYGLEVTDEVDERYDPVRSTQAAIQYLKRAYARYGNWESVAASYNAGMGRISSELASQGVSSAYDLWLNNETSRYIFRLLAMKALMDNPAQFGYRIRPDQLYAPVKMQKVVVDTPVKDWRQWALEHGTTYARLRTYNPWIRASSLTNRGGKRYIVEIPAPEALNRKTKSNVKAYNPRWVDQH